MALSSPWSSFHLASLFPIFCHQATTSNLRRVCSLKRVSYLTNLASTTTTFEALRFHCITWPCNSGITMPVSRSICGFKLPTISCDSCNCYGRTSTFWTWSAPWIPYWCLRVNAWSLSTQPIQYFFLVHLLHLRMLFQGGDFVNPLEAFFNLDVHDLPKVVTVCHQLVH